METCLNINNITYSLQSEQTLLIHVVTDTVTQVLHISSMITCEVENSIAPSYCKLIPKSGRIHWLHLETCFVVNTTQMGIQPR